MNIAQLKDGIQAKFEQSRIVFWHDPEQTFADEIQSLGLDNVRILDMAQASLFETKKRLEIDEPTGRFLLYFPHAEPAPEQDWLLDIRLYSQQFHADASSMLLNSLGISRMSLRSHIRERQSFFGNKQRLVALKRLVTDNEDEQSLDIKMMAVLVKADSASLSDILLCVLKDYALSLDTDDEIPALDAFDKFGLTERFWQLCSQIYGYSTAEPNLPDLSLKLFCTDLWKHLDAENKDWLTNNLLTSSAGIATALAFMASWRDSRTFSQYHDRIASTLERQLEVADQCRHYLPLELQDCEAFEAVEQVIIRGLVTALMAEGKPLDKGQFSAVISRRMNSHWTYVRSEYRSIYEALLSAQKLFGLRREYFDGFHYGSALEMYNAYTAKLFQFDQAYRLFNEKVDGLLAKGMEILRKLDEAIESLYTDWYLFELGTAWDRLIAQDGLMQSWTLSGIPAQSHFFTREVQQALDTGQIKRMFVVISDAFRYEVAEELVKQVNDGKRFKAELKSSLGCLPSTTQMGMAALLPHTNIAFSDDQEGTLLVDGRSAVGLESRNTILEPVGGMAISAKELLNWSNQEGREKVRDARIVYIYHDGIDAIGDKAPTEDRTFAACRDTLDELQDLIGRIINRLNGSRVILTADHGFLFQQKGLEATSKTGLQTKPPGTVLAKKRFLIGRNLPSLDECWKGTVTIQSQADGAMEFLLPKGAQRFHFAGGARFVHGGAMPQEICVPVVEIRELQKKQAAALEKKPVGVVVAGSPIKIVNNIDKVRFIQTDAVDDERFSSRSLDVYIVDPDGQTVSSRETIVFDSCSMNMDERCREVRLKLIGSDFDRLKIYTLILENSSTRTRYDQHKVTIDLAFHDDFF